MLKRVKKEKGKLLLLQVLQCSKNIKFSMYVHCIVLAFDVIKVDIVIVYDNSIRYIQKIRCSHFGLSKGTKQKVN